MKACVLASGSNGNSIFVETDESKILIDAGISHKKIYNNLSMLGYELDEINSIFITHEHTDHIKGLEQINKKTDIPIFMNKETYIASKLNLKNINFFSTKNISINDLEIKPVRISHDAANPNGFEIQTKNKTFSVLTDLGVYDDNIKQVIKNSNGVALETNHDIDMVLSGRYPYNLKQRILGEFGHLSNIDAGLLIKQNTSEKLKTVFLSHISKNNNSNELALKTFSQITKNQKIQKILTNQNEMTNLINI